MSCLKVRSFLQGIFLVLSLSLIVACTNGGGFPPIANPPPFDYADGEDIRSRMHQLAFELQQLDLMMFSEDNRDARFQQQVVASLQNIERIGGVLRESDLSTRHRSLLSDMSRFLNTVSQARRSAERNPPFYYQAGRVSGACTNCHRSAGS